MAAVSSRSCERAEHNKTAPLRKGHGATRASAPAPPSSSVAARVWSRGESGAGRAARRRQPEHDQHGGQSGEYVLEGVAADQRAEREDRAITQLDELANRIERHAG